MAGCNRGRRTQGGRLGSEREMWSAASGASASLATPPIPHSDEGKLLKSMGRPTTTPHYGGSVSFCREDLWSGPVSTEEPGWTLNLGTEKPGKGERVLEGGI